MVMFESTNRRTEAVGFREALFKGLAPDRGLYVPTEIPIFSRREIAAMGGKEYHEIAYRVMKKFVGREVSDRVLRSITRDAYDFDVPIERMGEGNIHVMRLDQGPTASFKDFAARMMARLMDHYSKGTGRKTAIHVATSGDTGSAIASAFHGLKNMKVIVLFPQGKVTALQRKQMTTLGDNVIPIAVAGTFDDCQRLVKTAFADPELAKKLAGKYALSSANSINIGRLIPQIAYYFWAHSRLARPDEKIVFSVPSGNFGNITAALMAKEMGLPVHKLVAATNVNDSFHRFMQTAVYRPRETVQTLSNAMDVGAPSNTARIFHFHGGHMDEKGNVRRTPDKNALKRTFYSTRVTDAATRAEIRRAYREHGMVLEPHGAVGSVGLRRLLRDNPEAAKYKAVVLETAHPGKFPEVVKKETGVELKAEALEKVKGKREHFRPMANDYGQFKDFLGLTLGG